MSTTWLWPVPGYTKISSNYGLRVHPTAKDNQFHKGIDISVPTGTPVLATAAGSIVYSQYSDTAGHWIMVKHSDGKSSRYLHLSSRLVKAGDTIDAGQTIALSGNTGTSTGPHLHFEIRSSTALPSVARTSPGNSLNPLDFVSPDNSKVVSGSTSTTSPTSTYIPATSYSQEDVDEYKNLVIVGRRVADTTDQPMHAYVQIWVGDRLLSTKPQFMQDFEIERYSGVGDIAKFTVFDDTWSEIEKTFADNWRNIYIQYGYIGPGGTGLSSPRYRMQLSNYSISFNSTGTFMTVNAMSVGSASDNLNPTTIETGTKNAGDAIRIICESMGWTVGHIESTPTTYYDNDEEFTMLNTFPITYIKEEILPDHRSRSTSGELLEFYLDANKVAYLVPESFLESLSTNSEIKTYIHQKGYDSPILDLTFDIKGIFGGTSQYGPASGLATSCFDPYTKEETSQGEDVQSVIISATGHVMHMDPNQSVPSVDSAGRTAVQARARLWYDVSKAATEAYEAQMTIVGDPSISLLDKVRIINVTDEGYLHHTSGIYMVKGVIDNVSGGQMTTSLKLVRNASGAMEAAAGMTSGGTGIQIISPKNLVK